MLLLLREKRLRASPLVARSTTARILFDVAGEAIIKTIREMRELTIRAKKKFLKYITSTSRRDR